MFRSVLGPLPGTVTLLAVLVLVVPTLALGASAADPDAETAARVQRMYEEYRARSFPDLPDLDVDEARALADTAEVVWLDVRGARERRVSVLPGAVDRRTYEQHREEWARRPVVVYCTVGYRSGVAAQELRNGGVEAFNLAGGILAWVHADGRVVDGRDGEPTRRVHVYGWRWNLVPRGWKGVW